jgi:hypothetical protein
MITNLSLSNFSSIISFETLISSNSSHDEVSFFPFFLLSSELELSNLFLVGRSCGVTT